MARPWRNAGCAVIKRCPKEKPWRIDVRRWYFSTAHRWRNGADRRDRYAVNIAPTVIGRMGEKYGHDTGQG